MNQALADEGLQGYGLRIGKILTDQVERKLLSDDLMTLAMRLSSCRLRCADGWRHAARHVQFRFRQPGHCRHHAGGRRRPLPQGR